MHIRKCWHFFFLISFSFQNLYYLLLKHLLQVLDGKTLEKWSKYSNGKDRSQLKDQRYIYFPSSFFQTLHRFWYKIASFTLTNALPKNNPVLVTRKEKYSTARTTKQKESQQTPETAAILFTETALFFSFQWEKSKKKKANNSSFWSLNHSLKKWPPPKWSYGIGIERLGFCRDPS